MKKLERINNGEKLADLLGYVELIDLKNNIMWRTEEMLEEGKLENFCKEQEDYITKEIYDMIPDLMMFTTYRKVLSKILIDELGARNLFDTFGKAELVITTISRESFRFDKNTFEEFNL